MKQNPLPEQSSAGRGRRFRCSVCGAEVLLIKAANGALRPRCCNKEMVLLKQPAQIYRCPICGSEVALLKGKSGNLHLICCNSPMRILSVKTPNVA
jgi:desulfoferrodoxin-like iron-binding protein